MTPQQLNALKDLPNTIEWLDDTGPIGEGWQSEQMMAGISALREVIEEEENG